MKLRKWLCTFGFLLLMPCFPGPAEAQNMLYAQRPNFGTFTVTRNDGLHSIIVTANNDVSYSPQIISLSDAYYGIFELTDFPTYTDLAINISNGTLSNGGGPVFNFIDPTHLIAQTDEHGNTTLYVGGTLQTSGTGQNYMSGTYTGNIQITITF